MYIHLVNQLGIDDMSNEKVSEVARALGKLSWEKRNKKYKTREWFQQIRKRSKKMVDKATKNLKTK